MVQYMANLSISFSTNTTEETTQAITESSIDTVTYQHSFEKSFQFDTGEIFVAIVLSVVIFKLAKKCINELKTSMDKQKG